jgi:hypothetical protein
LTECVLFFEALIDQPVATLLEVNSRAREGYPVEAERVTLPIEVPEKLPLTVTELKKTVGQDAILLR